MWTISNLLSFTRLLLAIPMCYLLLNNYNLAAAGIGILGVITDVLDGYFARKLNQITDFGKIIDPIADKVIVGATALVLIIQGRLPLWFGLIAFGRDALILLGGIYATKKLGIIIPSNFFGKITALFLSITLAFVFLDFPKIAYYAIYISTAMLIISFVAYGIGFIKKLSGQKNYS